MKIIKATISHLQQRCDQRGYSMADATGCIVKRDGDAIWVDTDSAVYPRAKDRGLGDTVARLTAAVGIKPCGGCKKRQAALNALVPYSPE